MSDLTPREARTIWALLKIRETQIKTQLKAALTYAARFIDQDPGDKNAAKLGAAKLGKVGMTEPSITAQVTDPEAFLKYVTEARPTEVETVTQVRPAYEKALLAELTQRGAAVDRDGTEVPGIEFRPASTPYQTFDAADNAAELLAVVEPEDLPEIDGIDLAAILGVRPATSDGQGAGAAESEAS
ncbi:hypothetical protein ACQEVF_25075 [Nonomuraea polychroma]|uniref:hypothetical protein n=1 Tax=Nonomuraea polychroma TaxID=46176 RepID=UPI003D8BDDD2